MIDASRDVVDLIHRHLDVTGKLLGRALDAVAEPDRFDSRGAVDGPGVHRHRIDVVEQGGIGAQRLHVAADIQKDRDRAQPAHDAADSQRVGDGLAQAVLLRNLEIDHGARLVAGDLEHGNGVVGVRQRRAAIEGCVDPRVCSSPSAIR